MAEIIPTIITTVTLNVTGRDIVNALKAGKSIMVHAEIDRYEEYNQPNYIKFSETEDEFFMSIWINNNPCNFNSTLDDPLTIFYSSNESQT